MKISDRIKAICDAVTSGETIADIGTDHAYVPLILYKNNVSPHVIMCDISADSLSKAKKVLPMPKLICLNHRLEWVMGLM